MAAPEMPPLLTVSEAAEACRTTPQTMRRWIHLGRVRVIKPGKSYLIPGSEIARLLTGIEVSQ